METKITTVSLKNCEGKEVIDNAGNKCGTIKGFLINPDGLNVPFVLIGEAGIWGTGIGKDFFIAPVKELRLDNPDAPQVPINVSQRRLKEAPKYPKSGFHEQDSELLNEITTYYGIEKDMIYAGRLTKEEYQHQSYEGSFQVTQNAPSDNQKISDEMSYDKIKGTGKEDKT